MPLTELRPTAITSAATELSAFNLVVLSATLAVPLVVLLRRRLTMSSFATVLLVSPCRSSVVTVVEEAAMSKLEARFNDLESIALYRPWRLASKRSFATREAAERCAVATAAASGVRARLRALDAWVDGGGGSCPAIGSFDDPRRSLDGLTYVMAEFSNPAKPKKRVGPLRMMVDTGSNDCELSGELINKLGLKPFETALFETAAGITTEAPVFKAKIHVMGREANVLLSPAEGESDDDDSGDDEDGGEEDFDEKFGFDKTSDDALLGHDALAELGFAVDCRKRELIPLPQEP